ncbi:MAG: hypothetical protein K5945_05080 [Bacteroidaceae bacterium]|nr:hypothetical protein [Bacteroidaceae bacterium]
MKKIFRMLMFAVTLMTLTATTGEARTPKVLKSKAPKSEKTKKVKVAKPPKLKSRTVWLSGVAFSELDSVAYITEFQKVDSAYLDGRNNFLADRQLYSMQLNAYLEDSLKCRHMMPAVIHSTKVRRAMKLRAKALKRFRNDPNWQLHELPVDAFRFVPEQWAKSDD